MFLMRDGEDEEILGDFKESAEKLLEKELKEKLSKQNFYQDKRDVFEPSIDQQN